MKANLRLVSRGFKQREVIGCRETYVSTIPSSCVRLLNAMACEHDLSLRHFYVGEAFVQPKLDADISRYVPKGYRSLCGKIAWFNKSL